MLTRVWRSALDDLRASPVLALCALVVSTAPMVYADLYMDDMASFRLGSLISIAMIPFQIAIIARGLARRDLIPADRPATSFFPRFFGQSLLAGLGFLLGVAFLIVPGILLMLRWAVSGPALIARDCGVMDSLRTSWAMTKGHMAFILGVHGPVIATLLGAFTTFVFLPTDFLGTMVSETLLSLTLLIAWYLQPALYAALNERDEKPA